MCKLVKLWNYVVHYLYSISFFFIITFVKSCYGLSNTTSVKLYDIGLSAQVWLKDVWPSWGVGENNYRLVLGISAKWNKEQKECVIQPYFMVTQSFTQCCFKIKKINKKLPSELFMYVFASWSHVTHSMLISFCFLGPVQYTHGLFYILIHDQILAIQFQEVQHEWDLLVIRSGFCRPACQGEQM